MTQNQPTHPTQVTRLTNGALIIGKTSVSKSEVTIMDPFTIIPSQEGLQLFPFDADILGEPLDEMTIDKSQTLYSKEPNKELITTYLTNLSGIILPKNDLII